MGLKSETLVTGAKVNKLVECLDVELFRYAIYQEENETFKGIVVLPSGLKFVLENNSLPALRSALWTLGQQNR